MPMDIPCHFICQVGFALIDLLCLTTSSELDTQGDLRVHLTLYVELTGVEEEPLVKA